MRRPGWEWNMKISVNIFVNKINRNIHELSFIHYINGLVYVRACERVRVYGIYFGI